MARKNNDSKQVLSTAHVVTPTDLQLVQTEHTPLSPVGFAQYIRVLRQNWRQGTVGCKTRAEVAFSNRKPWKQKGTGRARAGSLRSPLWRKGGIIFGPQPRTRTLKISKDLKRGVFRDLLWNKLQQSRIIACEYQELAKPSTVSANNVLRNANIHESKIVLFLATHDYNTQASFANLPNVRMYLFDQPNAYALSYGDYWVYLKKDSDLFKQMVHAWI